jgi:exosortase/archaeosortase family protein
MEACAGLQTMFTLEAMGLLYASVVNDATALRKVLLSILVIPVSFVANVIRVIVLALITYWWGDAAGQGFLHGFAGLLLFAVALALIATVDALLARALPSATAT